MAKAVEFFDSNVLIAASIPDHVHHRGSMRLLSRLQNGGGACAAHTLAEAYNTLTKYPKGYGISPADAVLMINHAARTYRLVSLTSSETTRAIEDTAQRGLSGSLIYDALILTCARKINADLIYTSNAGHFRKIAPDLASRITEP